MTNEDLMWEEFKKNEIIMFSIKWTKILIWTFLLFSVGMVIYLGLQIIF